MSRTKRHIPFDKRMLQPWELAWIGLGASISDFRDVRDALQNGYDNRLGQSWLYSAGDKYHDGDWRLSAKSRRWYKKRAGRLIRIKSANVIREEIQGLHDD